MGSALLILLFSCIFAVTLNAAPDTQHPTLDGNLPRLKCDDLKYELGSCCRERDPACPCIGVSSIYYGSSSPIVSVSALYSTLVTGFVMHKDGIFDLITCLPTGKETYSYYFPKDLKFTSIIGWNVIVVDETNFAGVTTVLLAARFIVEADGYQSGLAFITLKKHEGHKDITVNLISRYYDDIYHKLTKTEELTMHAQRDVHRLFYFVRSCAEDPKLLEIHSISPVDLTFMKYLTEPKGSLAATHYYIRTLEERVYDLGDGPFPELHTPVFEVRRSNPEPFATFSICDCVIAAAFLQGEVSFYCCSSLERLLCEIRSPFECSKCYITTIKMMQWCCCSGTLYVLYERAELEQYYHGSDNYRPSTFIIAYEVDTKRLVPYRKDGCCCESQDKYDCECTKRLYRIKGCDIVNFRVCCKPSNACGIVYALVKNWQNRYFLRSYSSKDGQLLATVALPYAVAGDSMAISIPLPKHHSIEQKCKCCRCGIFIPFIVKDNLIGPKVTRFAQPTACFCLRNCKHDGCSSHSNSLTENEEW